MEKETEVLRTERTNEKNKEIMRTGRKKTETVWSTVAGRRAEPWWRLCRPPLSGTLTGTPSRTPRGSSHTLR